MTRTHQKLAVFLAVTFAISSIYYFLILSAGSLQAGGGLYVFGLMWAPGIAAMATQLLFERTLRGLGWRLGSFRYLAIAFLLPLLYCLVVYGLTWLTGLGGFPNPEFLALIQQQLGGQVSLSGSQIFVVVLVSVVLSLPVSLLSALGEEIGWRGLFVPELIKVTSFTKTAFISGAVWAVWHLPLLLFSDYNMAGAPVWYAGIMFAVMVLGISFAFAWLRLKSGSLWTAALLHASHNLFVQGIFTPLTTETSLTPYIIDEFGIGLALAGLVVALIFWRRRGALQ
jgi:membrane protease YdiL (CAAX protease family)